MCHDVSPICRLRYLVELWQMRGRSLLCWAIIVLALCVGMTLQKLSIHEAVCVSLSNNQLNFCRDNFEEELLVIQGYTDRFDDISPTTWFGLDCFVRAGAGHGLSMWRQGLSLCFVNTNAQSFI